MKIKDIREILSDYENVNQLQKKKIHMVEFSGVDEFGKEFFLPEGVYTVACVVGFLKSSQDYNYLICVLKGDEILCMDIQYALKAKFAKKGINNAYIHFIRNFSAHGKTLNEDKFQELTHHYQRSAWHFASVQTDKGIKWCIVRTYKDNKKGKAQYTEPLSFIETFNNLSRISSLELFNEESTKHTIYSMHTRASSRYLKNLKDSVLTELHEFL